MSRVVVMGVSGCGKSTVGRMMADALGVPFVDGDDLHPRENIAKMAAGVPLTDADRWPWLADVGTWLAALPAGVVACSALKRSYRDAIRALAPDALMVHLDAPGDVLHARLVERSSGSGHFMGAAMLDSQMATLERLDGDEAGFRIDVTVGSAEEATRAAVDYVVALTPARGPVSR